MYGGVLEHLEGRVRLEGLSKRLCAIWADVVALETVDRRQIALSGGADSIGKYVGCKAPVRHQGPAL